MYRLMESTNRVKNFGMVNCEKKRIAVLKGVVSENYANVYFGEIDVYLYMLRNN